jgi:hypothetical protein
VHRLREEPIFPDLARGFVPTGNPLLRPANAPVATGECARAWALRRDAWQAGYDAQRLPRRWRGAFAAGGRSPMNPEVEVLIEVPRWSFLRRG